MPNNPNSSLDNHEDRIRALEAILHPLIQHPLGAITVYAGKNPPLGWCLCDGRSLSATTYKDLYAVIGTTYGGNSTNFKIPDLRGYFVRALDNGRGVDGGRTIGSTQGDAIRNITGKFSAHEFTAFHNSSLKHEGALYATGEAWFSGNQDARDRSAVLGFDASRVVPVAAENRPKNIAMNYIIKIAQVEGITPNKDMLDMIMAELSTKLGANGSVVNGDLVINGSITATRVYGSVWNDYAEWLKSDDCECELGDIIAMKLEGDSEVYERADSNSVCIAGVYSSEYGHILGGISQSECDPELTIEENNKKAGMIPVGMVGRVLVKVCGYISKGDKIVPSGIKGVGKKYNYLMDNPDNIIGYALEEHIGEEVGLIRMKLALR